ncbi:hypothetical protein ACIAD2951 [Acinetobacter baylyi ADP1]|uniref:Uncharacterized protein n=2 Tax=Moraxellaceae TaxID=468 RepID=Q6F8E9_ACIAD|nr:hypothetical protein ACIAD2951 [Acinetobacter baylyi ADP1]
MKKFWMKGNKMTHKSKKFKPNHEYKIGFGVNQAEKIGKAANKVNETPKNFIKKAVLDSATSINQSSEIVNK